MTITATLFAGKRSRKKPVLTIAINGFRKEDGNPLEAEQQLGRILRRKSYTWRNPYANGIAVELSLPSSRTLTYQDSTASLNLKLSGNIPDHPEVKRMLVLAGWTPA
jgi:hypothetical protein